ncbi:hypothetical protein L6164_016303 [Bauhinia variegata]|uniref:Uncharacterized protein n=1 Tax=Bauhinia variegata TaxID=167791 RepID=A0ACB9NPJ1_BAUVA|nr:hypothetical protein L6164_016303 [Bauhinia variegata]
MATSMAPAATVPSKFPASNISSIKTFAESNGDAPIPSTFYSITEPPDDVARDLAASIPVIDLSLLNSDDPQLHFKAVQQLGKACQEWGFFMITNHGISENLMEDVMNKSNEYHNLPLEERKEFANKGYLEPIVHGTSFFPQAETANYWRDYLRVITHPQFNFPHKPQGYKELAFEYSRKIRGVARILLQAISESLGLEADAIIESTDFDSGLQIFFVNLYPPCPQPDLSLGIPPHSDHGLLTLLTQNGVGGLQVKHHGKWVEVDPLPKCILVNTGDQLEVVSNGRYKSVLHRAVLNNRDTRISVVLVNGPALDKDISPAQGLLEKEKPLFESRTYNDYVQDMRKSKFADKSALSEIRL